MPENISTNASWRSALKNKIKALKFSDSTCWITGASSGIGRAIAILLAQKGARLILTGRSLDKLETTKERCGSADTIVLQADLEEMNGLADLTQKAIDGFGGIDFFFHCAGFSQRSRVEETSIETYQRLMNIHYFSAVAISKLLLNHYFQKGRGHFVMISSLSGKFGVPFRSGYAAAKHALHGFFDSLRAEQEANNIRVTIACPGYVKTDISLNALNADGRPQNKMDKNQANGISAESCARQILQAVEKQKAEVYIGGKEILSIYIKRFFPRFLNRIVRKAVNNQ